MIPMSDQLANLIARGLLPLGAMVLAATLAALGPSCAGKQQLKPNYARCDAFENYSPMEHLCLRQERCVDRSVNSGADPTLCFLGSGQ